MRLRVAPSVCAEAYEYRPRSSGERHGVVLTRGPVIRAMLDLAGYRRTSGDILSKKLLDPACGPGGFVVAAARRLVLEAREAGVAPHTLEHSIRAYDVDSEHVERARTAVAAELMGHSALSSKYAVELARTWIKQGDFLLSPQPLEFDVVVGNPPYIRIEELPHELMKLYGQKYRTFCRRADLYVAFIERSLSLLSDRGVLSFICADRWTRNDSGRELRGHIAQSFSVAHYFDMHKANPFESSAAAYAAIVTIARKTEKPPVFAKVESVGELEEIAESIGAGREHDQLEVNPSMVRGSAPWLVLGTKQARMLKYLEDRFFPLSETAEAKSGIATGDNTVFIVPRDMPVEPDRLVSIATHESIQGGKLADSGLSVINTCDSTGKLVDLADYPLLARHLRRHRSRLSARAHTDERSWYRTKMRVQLPVTKQPKLLIPVGSNSNAFVFDPGSFYPDQSLYAVLTDHWDPEVLGALLSSRVALFCLWSYSHQIRGGYLRFERQYLNRIRLPDPDHLNAKLRGALKDAFRDRDFAKIDALAMVAYGLHELPVFDYPDCRA